MSALMLVLMPEHRPICPISKIRSPDAHVAADCSLPVGMRPLDITVADGEEHPASRGKANLSGSSTISACLPHGVKLTLQYGDVDSLTAIIGVLCHVQTGR